LLLLQLAQVTKLNSNFHNVENIRQQPSIF